MNPTAIQPEPIQPPEQGSYAVTFDRIGAHYEVLPLRAHATNAEELADRIRAYARKRLPRRGRICVDIDTLHAHGWIIVRTGRGKRLHAHTVGSFVIESLNDVPLRHTAQAANAAEAEEYDEIAYEFQEHHGDPKTWPVAVQVALTGELVEVDRHFHPERYTRPEQPPVVA